MALLVAVVGLGLLVRPAAVRAEGAAVYHFGNSHTATVKDDVTALAHMMGKKDQYFRTFTVPGAPLELLRSNRNWERARESYANHSWDFVTLQTYNRTSQGETDTAIYFSKLAFEKNPDVKILMYAIWPGPLESWDNPGYGRTQEWTEHVAGEIEKALPGIEAAVAPTSLVIRELGDLADEGRVPGLTSRFDLFGDVGHLSRTGSYVVACVFYAMMYQESPVGASHEMIGTRRGEHGQVGNPDETSFSLEPETAEYIQKFVWDVLATYPPAEVNVGLIISTRNLEAALQDREYSVQLATLNEEGATQWSVVGGELPPGISLSATGILKGTPTQSGTYEVRVRVEDEQASHERDLRLVVAEDVPPEITTVELATSPADQYVYTQLKAEKGVGKRIWELVDGFLPPGMRISQSGVLSGTPGASGQFGFTIRTTDSHPDEPKTDEQQYLWTIDPKEPETLVASRPANPEFKLDGVLDEGFWNLDNKITKVVQGDTTVTGRFDVVYDDAGNNVLFAVQVEDGGQGPQERDGVHIYGDILNNEEIIYNFDDYHMFYPRGAEKGIQVQGQRSRFGYRNFVMKETDDGYVWEASFPAAKMFFGDGILQFLAPQMVYGFDVGISTGATEADEAILMWHGDLTNNTDTSTFGKILIGQLPDAAGDLVEQNIVEWSFTPEDAEPPLVLRHPWIKDDGELTSGERFATFPIGSAVGYDSFAVRFLEDTPEFHEDAYIEFRLAPREGKALSLSWLNFPFWSWRKDQTMEMELRWSTDGFATHQTVPFLQQEGTTVTMGRRRGDNLELDANLGAVEGLQGLDEPVTFRLYMWGHQVRRFGIGRRNLPNDIILVGRMDD